MNSKNIKNSNKIVLYLLLFFLVLRIGIVIIAGQKESQFADGVSYNGYATAIFQNSDWLTKPDFLGDYRPPGYPLFIAIVYAIFGVNNFLAVYIFQAIISTLTCFYIYKFSKKIFNEKAALISLIWSGFYVFYFKYVRAFLRETLVFFFIIAFFYYLFLYLCSDSDDKKSYTKHLVLSLIFYSFLIHTDPRYLFFLPFLIILYLIYQPFWQGVKKYLIFLGLTILLMIPWTIRNYIAYNGIVIICTRGIDLRTTDEQDHKMDVYKQGVFNFSSITSTNNANYPSKYERDLIKLGKNPKNRSEDEIIAIQQNIYPDSTYLARKWYNFISLWRPFDFKRSYRPFPDARFNGIWSYKHNLSSILCYGVLLPFMLIAFYLLVKESNRFWIFPLLIFYMHSLLHILEHGRNRYRHPVDFLIIMLGTYGIYFIYKNFLKRREKYEAHNPNSML